jgi:predicted dehydrogenase
VAHVTAAGGNNVYKDRETVDHAAIIVEYESGVKLGFDFCLFGQDTGPQARRMMIIGSEGSMTPENGKVAVRSRKGRAMKLVDVTDSTPEAVTEHAIGSAQDPETYQQYLLFEKTVRAGAPPLVNPEEAKNAIKLVLLAEKSMRTHRIMSWNDLPA